MKKLLTSLFIILGMTSVYAIEVEEASIDLDSVKYNRKTMTSEVKMNIYNQDYHPGSNEIYYAIYYLKMDCKNKNYKSMMAQAFNKQDQLLTVDYEERPWVKIQDGSNIEQAYNFACEKYFQQK